MSVKVITAENFDEEILNFNGKAIIDFWAEWCGPCRLLSPIIDEIAEERPDIKVCKVNCDDDRDLALSFGISAIPCVLFFENGELKDKSIGFVNKEDIINKL